MSEFLFSLFFIISDKKQYNFNINKDQKFIKME